MSDTPEYVIVYCRNGYSGRLCVNQPIGISAETYPTLEAAQAEVPKGSPHWAAERSKWAHLPVVPR